jgi:hypothetical protein
MGNGLKGQMLVGLGPVRTAVDGGENLGRTLAVPLRPPIPSRVIQVVFNLQKTFSPSFPLHLW